MKKRQSKAYRELRATDEELFEPTLTKEIDTEERFSPEVGEEGKYKGEKKDWELSLNQFIKKNLEDVASYEGEKPTSDTAKAQMEIEWLTAVESAINSDKEVPSKVVTEFEERKKAMVPKLERSKMETQTMQNVVPLKPSEGKKEEKSIESKLKDVHKCIIKLGTYVKGGITPDDDRFTFPLEEWEEYGFSYEEAIPWDDKGIDPAEALQWDDSGFTPDEAFSWAEFNFSIEEATEWKELGFSCHEAYNLRKLGKFPREAAREKARTKK